MGRIGISLATHEPLELTSICVWPEWWWEPKDTANSGNYDLELNEHFIRPFTRALELSAEPVLKGRTLNRWVQDRIESTSLLNRFRMIGHEELEQLLYDSVHEFAPGAALGIRESEGKGLRALFGDLDAAARWAIRPGIEFVVDLPTESAHAVLFCRDDATKSWMSRLRRSFEGAGQSLHRDDLRLRTLIIADKAIKEGRYPTALEFWNRRISAEPWNAPLLVEVAMIYAQMSLEKAAREEFTRYLGVLKQWK